VTVPAAHGVRIGGLEATPWLALAGAERWPAVEVGWQAGVERALTVDVEAGRATLREGVTEAEAVHPLSTGIGLHYALARGFDALHAGAVAGPGGVWAVVGPKGAGKSTLLAACARRGLPVLSDDALVYDGSRCFAGPRCIDLRPDAAARLGVGEAVRGEAQRRRLTLPPIAGEGRLAGLVHLAWGSSVEVRPLSPGEKLARLLARHAEDAFPRDPVGVLDLAALPGYELARARDWDCLDAAAALLGDLAAGVAARTAA
jgi:hypothetical protein